MAESALKHAVVGSVVGDAVAQISHYASAELVKVLPATTGPMQMVGVGIVQGTVSALLILAGDQLISRVVTQDDPLFRMFYYMVAFNKGPAGYGYSNAARGVWNMIVRSGSAGRGSMVQGPYIQKKCDDCTKTGKSCSGCAGH